MVGRGRNSCSQCRARFCLDQAPGPASMTLRRLKLLAILAPLLFLAALELARQVISPALFQGWPGQLLLAGIVLLGTLFFAEAIFGVVNRLQTQLAQQNQELLALHDAGLGILG